MESLNTLNVIVPLWTDICVNLVLRICTVFFILIFFNLKFIRPILLGAETRLNYRLYMILGFGLLGILGTHGSVVVDLDNYTLCKQWVDSFIFEKDSSKAYIGFRDTMAMLAGLFGGPLVGFWAGFISGVERFTLGGVAPLGSGITSMALGLGTGMVRRFYPWPPLGRIGTIIVVLIGTALQRIILVYDPFENNQFGWQMVIAIGIPVAIVNIIGCLLLFKVMSELDQDKKRQDAEHRVEKEIKNRKKAELAERETRLRSLNSQVTWHTYYKPLNNMQYLVGLGIDGNDSEALDRVYDACGKVANYFRKTLIRCTSNEAITLEQDYLQLEEYLDLTNLKYYKKSKPRYDFDDIPPGLQDCLIPPATLLTLAENALEHGNKDNRDGFVLHVSFDDLGDSFIIRVRDNGSGIPADRVNQLGKHQVQSTKVGGGGTGLYRLVQSLQLHFSGLAQWGIASPDGTGTEVVLTLPKRWRRNVIIIDEKNLFQEDFEFILRSQYRDFSIVGNEINDEIWKLIEQEEIDGVFISHSSHCKNSIRQIKAVNNPPWVVFVTNDARRIFNDIRPDELLRLPLDNTEVENIFNAIRNKYTPNSVFETKYHKLPL